MSGYSARLCLTVTTLTALAFSPALAAAPGDLQTVAEDNAAFAFELYHKLREARGNLFFSPHSISTALAMTYAGARGLTQKEMANVLHFSSDQATIHGVFSELQSHMKAIQEEGHVRLSIANSLWCQRGYTFLDAFLDLTERCYGAGLNFVDFEGQTEAARDAINAWGQRETEEKIRELIKPGILSPLTTLVLCNAIYFRGDWARQFDKRKTHDADFFITPDRTVKVPMMTRTLRVKWNAFDSFSAVELPYEGDDVSMVVLLPKAVDGLPELEGLLTKDNVKKWLRELAQSQSSEVTVQLPRFTTNCELELAEVLAAMGMPSAFRGADFSGMTGERDLFISNVIHKAYVDVNEEGTEAAAATAVLLKRGGPVYRVDRPFVFLIRERRTGSILFIGRIVDPTK